MCAAFVLELTGYLEFKEIVFQVAVEHGLQLARFGSKRHDAKCDLREMIRAAHLLARSASHVQIGNFPAWYLFERVASGPFGSAGTPALSVRQPITQVRGLLR